MRRMLIILGVLSIITVAVWATWKLTTRPSDKPIQISPKQGHPIAEVEYFLQNDPQWAEDLLGSSSFNMSRSGCLVSCIAASLDAQGIDTDPGKLNQMFSQNGVYNSDGEVLWGNISKVLPNVRVTVPPRVDPVILEKAVADGTFPIVKVKYNGTGYQHWVLLIGASENDYLCMDPMSSSKQPLPLSKHGGVIYRYRIVTVDR